MKHEPHAIEVLTNRLNQIEWELAQLKSGHSISYKHLMERNAELDRLNNSINYFMEREHG